MNKINIKNILTDKLNVSLGFVVLFRVLGVIFTFGLNFIIGKKLGAYHAGLYFQVYSIFMVCSLIAGFGLNNTVFIKASEMISSFNVVGIQSIIKKSSSIILGLSVLLIGIFYISDGILDNFLSNESKHFIKIIILGLFPFILLGTITQTLQAIKQVVIASFFQGFLGNFLVFTAAFLLLYKEESIEKIIISFVIIYWVISIIAWLFLRTKLSQIPQKQESKVSYNGILNFSKYLFIISVMSTILANIDVIILGKYVNEEDIGLFGMALKVSLLISFILPSLNSIYVPIMSNHYVNKEYTKVAATGIKSSKIMTLLSLPFIIIALIFNTQIMAIFGEEFASAGVVLAILTLGQIIRCLSASSGFIAMSYGREKSMALGLVITFIIHLVLFFIIVPYYGIIGAAIVRTISLSIQDLYSIYLSKKILGVYPVFGIDKLKKIFQ